MVSHPTFPSPSPAQCWCSGKGSSCVRPCPVLWAAHGNGLRGSPDQFQTRPQWKAHPLPPGICGASTYIFWGLFGDRMFDQLCKTQGLNGVINTISASLVCTYIFLMSCFPSVKNRFLHANLKQTPAITWDRKQFCLFIDFRAVSRTVPSLAADNC